MRTLFITSLYANLFGTEFGGRTSRQRHYRESLLNILNMNPTRCVCFTSAEEYNELCDFFYQKNNVSKGQLELKVFNLFDTKYFSQIREKKDIEVMKKLDRCFEIQYNKFLWFNLIQDRFDYDRVYWIDAGLSHGGLFPDEYIINKNPHGSYQINLFTPDFIKRINKETDNKILILSKNNTGGLFWSQTIPSEYYINYDRSRHIIGGMFGGTPKMFEKYVNEFEKVLIKLLDKEKQLYMEEQIMTCLYFNDKDFFITKEFDDWYRRPHHGENEHKYFYEIFK
jgi:hypothetical protein